jgi:hypothetical protein
MKRKLPIGIQDFTSIREEGFVYVDKTARIHDLVTGSGRYFFLSRPRRFGKSLLCSTLGALFEGRRELFGGIAGRPSLALDGREWEWKKHPVIRIDLNPGNYSEGKELLNAMLRNNLETTASKLGLSLRGTFLPESFINLIADGREKFNERAVILIDEYDKPLLSTIDNVELQEQLRDILKGFYGVLKSAGEHLKFVLITGVTKSSQVSVFSDLNNLTDISLNPEFCDICGITQEELELNFVPEIEAGVKQNELNKQEYMDRLRHFYNGYRFSEKAMTVYNPYGLLSHFFNNGKFDSYWYSTATPAFLIKLIKEQKIDVLDLEKKVITLRDFQKFTIDKMNALPVLYQAGYLTISGYNKETEAFVLDYPNEEVRASFADSLLEQYLEIENDEAYTQARKLDMSLTQGNIEDALHALRSVFASIPYDIQIKAEKYYQTIVYLLFRMVGLNCLSELRTADGRIDILVETKKYVYCFEFKLNGTAEEALRQIDTKEYLLQWKSGGKKLFKIGIDFDFKKRGIGSWKISEKNAGALS